MAVFQGSRRSRGGRSIVFDFADLRERHGEEAGESGRNYEELLVVHAWSVDKSSYHTITGQLDHVFLPVQGSRCLSIANAGRIEPQVLRTEMFKQCQNSVGLSLFRLLVVHTGEMVGRLKLTGFT
jgi:hypothetical protein